jgi:hypothetical protein
MKPLTLAMADRAHRALTYVLDQLERHAEPEDIITGLIDNHRAYIGNSSGIHQLRYAGIVSSSVTNDTSTLLHGWRRNAVVHLSIMI